MTAIAKKYLKTLLENAEKSLDGIKRQKQPMHDYAMRKTEEEIIKIKKALKDLESSHDQKAKSSNSFSPSEDEMLGLLKIEETDLTEMLADRYDKPGIKWTALERIAYLNGVTDLSIEMINRVYKLSDKHNDKSPAIAQS